MEEKKKQINYKKKKQLNYFRINCYCSHIECFHNVSVDVTSDLQLYRVELRNLHRRMSLLQLKFSHLIF